MRIPERINILGFYYKTIFDQTIERQRDLAGMHSADRQELVLDAHMTEQNLWATYIHEIFEALNSRLALNLEHDTIDRLETAWFQVLTTNNLCFSKECKCNACGHEKEDDQ